MRSLISREKAVTFLALILILAHDTSKKTNPEQQGEVEDKNSIGDEEVL